MKIKKYYIILIALIINHYYYYSQVKQSIREYVNVPDTLRYKLACYLVQKDKLLNKEDSSYLSIIVLNLSNSKSKKYKYGIYIFKLISPHSNFSCYIHIPNKFYIFKKEKFEDIIQEYLEIIKESNMNTYDKIYYLKLLLKFIINKEKDNEDYFIDSN